MPLPKKGEKEDKKEFMSRCMSDEKLQEEFSKPQQRIAYCLSNAGYSPIEAADYTYNYDTYGFAEELNENNFYIPAEAEYEDVGEETEEWDVSEARPGLWENIRKKKEREGKNYKPAQPGDPDRPTQEQIKRAQSYVEVYADHAEADKPGPKDPRRTPAPKKDQKKAAKKISPIVLKTTKERLPLARKQKKG